MKINQCDVCSFKWDGKEAREVKALFSYSLEHTETKYLCGRCYDRGLVWGAQQAFQESEHNRQVKEAIAKEIKDASPVVEEKKPAIDVAKGPDRTVEVKKKRQPEPIPEGAELIEVNEEGETNATEDE